MIGEAPSDAMTPGTSPPTEWRAGWRPLAAGVVGVFTCVLHLYSSGLFFEPIQNETGWSRALLASSLTILSAVTLISAPLVGHFVDRSGSRRVALAGIVVYCLSFSAVSLVTTPLSWQLVWIGVGLGSAMIGPPVWAAAVAPYFNKSRGLALAIILSGGGLTLIAAPTLARFYIDEFGWRVAYVALAGTWAVIFVPVVSLLLPKRLMNAEIAQRRGRIVDVSTLKDAGLFSRRFLLLLLSGCLANGILVTLTVHFVPIATSGGLTRGTATALAAVIGFAAIVGRLCTGLLLDRFNATRVGFCFFLLPMAVALLLLIPHGGVPATLCAALMLGLSFGAEFDIVAYLASRLFKLENFGLLFGALTGTLTMAGGSGPLLAGKIYDEFGGYHVLLMGIPIGAVIAATLLLGLGEVKPGRHAATPCG